MSVWRSAAVACTLAAAAVSGISAQPARPQARVGGPDRMIEIMSGSGSAIGVSVRDVDAAAGSGSGQAAAPGGVVIEDVNSDGPAAKAGIRKDDVVVEYDGERVRSVRQFRRLVQETPAGRSVPAVVVRGDQRVPVTVEPRSGDVMRFAGEVDAARIMRDVERGLSRELPPPPPPPPAAPPGAAPPVPPVPPPPGAWPLPEIPDMRSFIWRSEGTLGIGVSPLSDQLAGYFGVKNGVLVTEVREGSTAAAAGFKAGDIVTSLNGADVTDPADLRRRSARLEDGSDFSAGIVRDRKPLTLKGKVQSTRLQKRAGRVSL